MDTRTLAWQLCWVARFAASRRRYDVASTIFANVVQFDTSNKAARLGECFLSLMRGDVADALSRLRLLLQQHPKH